MKSSYYFVLALVTLWIVHLWKWLEPLPFSAKLWAKNHYPALIVALGLATLCFVSVGPSFKVLSDETNVLCVSRSMCFNKTVENTNVGLYYYGNFHTLTSTQDGRPFLFPFVVSLLHTIAGYHPMNSFLANYIVMVLLLMLIYIGVREFLDPLSAYAAMILAASCPQFAICGASGGIELLSVFILGIVFFSLYHYLNTPTSRSFAFLWVTLLLMAHTREESFIFFFIVLGLIHFLKRIPPDHLRESTWLLSATPALTLPLFWQRILMLHDYQTPQGDQSFSAGNLMTHLTLFLKSQFNLSYDFPYPHALHLLGLGIFLFLFFKTFVTKRIFQTLEQKHFLIVVFACIAVHLIVIMSFWGGTYIHPAATRYFLLFSLTCAMAPVLFSSTLPDTEQKHPFILLLLAFNMFILYHPIAVEGRFMNSLILKRESDFCYEFLANQPDKNVVVVAGRPGQYTALNFGAVDFNFANRRMKDLQDELNGHLCRDVFVFQHILFQTHAPIPEDNLGSAFILEPLAERQTAAQSFMRISRVKDIQLAAALMALRPMALPVNAAAAVPTKTKASRQFRP